MENIQTPTPSSRTLRRQQRALIIADLESDLDIVARKLDEATTIKESMAYQNLYDIIYQSYCDAVKSEI